VKSLVAFAALGGALVGCQGPVRPVAVTFGDHADLAAIRITGLTMSQRQALEGGRAKGILVTAAPADAPIADLTSLAGRWATHGDTVVFRPRFRPRGGLTLRLAIDTALLAGRGSATLLVRETVLPDDAVSGAEPGLLAIHPGADSVPENMLRFYFEFATPMRPGEALQRIRLLTTDGSEVTSAFLDVSQELWDPTGRRLTLLFDPGRVKRGIRTNLELGRPLRAGRRYRLEVDAGWPDQRGRSLGRAAAKAFLAVSADEHGPDPSRWRIEPPAIGSRDPLVVRLEAPVDHALAERLIAVTDDAGQSIAGEATIDSDDRVWRFVPAARWLAGPHQLMVSPELEDAAGNRPGRAFDRDIASTASAGPPPQLVRRFEPRTDDALR
jgi:hypothetical protein